ASVRGDGAPPGKERLGVPAVGNARLPEQLHGPHVEVGRFRMRRGTGVLLDQHALDALRVEMERGREADRTAANDEDLGAETRCGHGKLPSGSATTGFSIAPSFSISMRTTSPTWRKRGGCMAPPPPDGGPGVTTSPGSSLNALERCSTWAKQSQM